MSRKEIPMQNPLLRFILNRTRFYKWHRHECYGTSVSGIKAPLLRQHQKFQNPARAYNSFHVELSEERARYIEIRDLQRSGATTSRNYVSRAGWLVFRARVSISHFPACARGVPVPGVHSGTRLVSMGRTTALSSKAAESPNIIF